jgi:phage terminase large subunit-like protein
VDNPISNVITTLKQEFPNASSASLMRMAMRISIPAFAITCFPKTVPLHIPPVHYEVYNLLEDSSIKRAAIALPRGLAKSTIASFLYVMWKILHKPAGEDLFITIISEAQSQSVNFLSRIKNALDRNSQIHKYFGDFGSNSSVRWREDDIIIANGSRITALGTGQKVRGNIQDDTRPNIIILDDFESELNAKTPEARQSNRKWILEAVEPSLNQINGRLIAIGTTISEDCFLQWVKDAPDWTVIWKAVIDENGDSIWPEMYPLELIEKKRRGFEHLGNLSGFFQEYMNQPQSPDDAPFKQHYMRNYSGELTKEDNRWYLEFDGKKRLLNVFMGVDLASSLGQRSDYTVLATIGKDAWGNEYLLDINRSKSDPARHPDMIIDCFNKWKHQGVYIESQAYQESCRATVRAKCIELGIHIPGIERKITHRTSKSERLMSLVPLFAQGKFYFRPTDLESQREFLSFPKGKNDDLLDGIWLASNYGYKPVQKEFDTDAKAKPKLVRRGWMVA